PRRGGVRQIAGGQTRGLHFRCPRARFMMLRFITGAMAVFALVFLDPHAGARAAGDSDPARFRLTGALLDRMEAVAADLRVSAEVDDDDDDDGEGAYEAGSDAGHDDQSVEDIALELDADPRVRAAL